ncbi:unnamed protein product [Plutella xylostella]|uniref:(diamondback moth) hypothetical protein n=1 Tax=Plutella xylostella TaxID=51655 RepID=A0A8S4G629_PLUXY|nr:unnamed protein product [Plutella xylostella]
MARSGRSSSSSASAKEKSPATSTSSSQPSMSECDMGRILTIIFLKLRSDRPNERPTMDIYHT